MCFFIIMKTHDDEKTLFRTKFEKIVCALDERIRRLYAAAEVFTLSRGGVSKATGPGGRFMSDLMSWLPKNYLLHTSSVR